MPSLWKSEQVFLHGDDYFLQLIHDIDHARSSVTVEIYIFNDDILGQKIADSLVAAALRGVKIQVIVDGIGSSHFFQKLYGQFIAVGIKIKIFNPLPFLHPYYGRLSFIQKIQALFLRMWRMNKRDHRKIITIDEEMMFIGSFNFAVEHTRMLGLNPWKDSGVKVTGEKVKYAVLHFKRMWRLREYYQYKKKLKSLQLPHWKDFPLRLNSTVFMKRYYHKDFLRKLKSAQTRIWLMTPYFIPTRAFIHSLTRAARRGVDVRIILSSRSDVELFLSLQTFYYPFLIKSGVKIYLYTESVLHAKTYIFDQWMTVGTSNLNHRSLIHDLEVDLVVQEEENQKTLENDFLETISHLRPLTMDYMGKRSFIDKALSSVYFLFRYWL